LIFVAFFIGALGEELGWSGYITDSLQKRWGALGASVLLGLVWAAWHVVPHMQAHRSVAWMGWYALLTVATRVVMVWIFNNTGKSVFGAAVFHAMLNLSWFLIPDEYFDPRIEGLIITFVAVIVVVVWGPPNNGDVPEPLGIAETGLPALFVRKSKRSLWSSLGALFALLLAFPIVYFWLVAPANTGFLAERLLSVPPKWTDLRSNWRNVSGHSFHTSVCGTLHCLFYRCHSTRTRIHMKANKALP
jgi:Type II CAAX prenyl endopeptidase Rce1-like